MSGARFDGNMYSVVKRYLRLFGLRGLVFVVLRKLLRRPGVFAMRRADCAHPIYLRMPSSDVATYKQIFVDREFDCRFEGEPGVIVDAGANIGLTSVFFANLFPRARIIAIEPESGNFEMLKRNVVSYPNVVPLHAALWNRNEEIDIVDAGTGYWGFMTAAKQEIADRAAGFMHSIHAFTVDRIVSDYALPVIDILKIDIEGAEREVFSDTSAWIDKVEAMIVELHERKKRGCNRAFYRGSEGFEHEWMSGEHVFLARGDSIQPLSTI